MGPKLYWRFLREFFSLFVFRSLFLSLFYDSVFGGGGVDDGASGDLALCV